MTKGCFLTCILFGLMACSGPKEKIPDTAPMTTNSRKMVIYQMMTRLFGNRNITNKPYGTIEENGVGKFNDISDKALKELAALGVSHVWYTGVLEHAVLTDYTKFGIPLDDADVVKGRAGSPYAIKDYYDVNPDLAVDVPNRLKEFDDLVARTHSAGLKVIIDFVPNHVARAYASDQKPEGIHDLGADDDKTLAFSSKNNFYYIPGQSFSPPHDYVPLGGGSFPTRDGKFAESPAKATGNDQFSPSPGINDWFETVKLNYGVDVQHGRQKSFDPIPDTWLKMKDILSYWSAKNVDGFRCDMAEMIPVEFWHWVIPQIKSSRPDILFIAEIYNPGEYRNYLSNGQFDFLYDKVQLYDTLRLLTNQRAATSDIAHIQKHLSGINDHMLHFLENHDEQRIASPFFASEAWKAVPGMVISATIDKGPVMIYFGQELGEKGAGATGFSGDDGRTSIYDYCSVPTVVQWVHGGTFDETGLTDEQRQLRQFYGDILNFAASNPAITSGEYVDITEHNVGQHSMSDKIHAFVRVAGEERLVIVSGFNTKTERPKIQLTREAVDRLGLQADHDYIGRDLLRSGTDIGLDKSYSFELDVPPYSAFIFKIK